MISKSINKIKPYVGEKKVKKAYVGATKVFSAGNWVTYHVDTQEEYSLEIDEGNTVLSPTTFTPVKAGWSFIGWREDTTATSSVLSNKTMGDNAIDLYAVYEKDVTVTFYDNAEMKTRLRKAYYNGSGSQAGASFTLSQATKTDEERWTARGWSTTNRGDADITYGNGVTFEISEDITLYGLYQKTNYLYYNGNGANSGAIETQGYHHYWAPDGHVYPTAVLATNVFERTDYVFNGWDLGKEGDTIVLTESTTVYAEWILATVNAYTAQEVNAYYKYTGNLTNSEYVTYSFSDNPLSAGAHINSDYGSESEQEKHGSITINYNNYYTRAVIELYPAGSNEYNNDREAWYRYWINGDTAPGWSIVTSSVHTITMYANSDQTVLNLGVRATIDGDNDGNYTWVNAALAIKSITLYNQ